MMSNKTVNTNIYSSFNYAELIFIIIYCSVSVCVIQPYNYANSWLLDYLIHVHNS